MSWELKTLGETCKMYQPKTIAKADLNKDGKYSVYGANGIIGKYNEYNHEKRQLLVTCRGATCGSINISEPFSWINGNAMVIDPQNTISLDFLKYHFSMANFFGNVITGSAQPQITRKSLEKLEISVPPHSKQKQIVETLDKAFEKIDKAIANIERNIENAEELFQSKVNGIFNQNGYNWTQMTLGEIGKVSMCKRILKKETNTTGGIPFFKIGTFGKKANAYISKNIYQEFRSKYSFPKKGDILISASGTIGRRVVYDGEPAYFQDSNIVWIDNNEFKILNEYLYHFYGVCEWNPSKGATISRLYNDDLRRIKISFPDKDMQLKLVEQVESLKQLSDSLLSDYIKKLDNLKELRKSILEKAFKGKLTNAA